MVVFVLPVKSQKRGKHKKLCSCSMILQLKTFSIFHETHVLNTKCMYSISSFQGKIIYNNITSILSLWVLFILITKYLENSETNLIRVICLCFFFIVIPSQNKQHIIKYFYTFIFILSYYHLILYGFRARIKNLRFQLLKTKVFLLNFTFNIKINI